MLKMDILDELQEMKGYVRLTLKSGEIIYGRSDCIVFDEIEGDEGDYEIVKSLIFLPMNEKYAYYLTEDDVESFSECRIEDIPSTEKDRPLITDLDYALVFTLNDRKKERETE